MGEKLGEGLRRLSEVFLPLQAAAQSGRLQSGVGYPLRAKERTSEKHTEKVRIAPTSVILAPPAVPRKRSFISTQRSLIGPTAGCPLGTTAPQKQSLVFEAPGQGSSTAPTEPNLSSAAYRLLLLVCSP